MSFSHFNDSIPLEEKKKERDLDSTSISLDLENELEKDSDSDALSDKSVHFDGEPSIQGENDAKSSIYRDTGSILKSRFFHTEELIGNEKSSIYEKYLWQGILIVSFLSLISVGVYISIDKAELLNGIFLNATSYVKGTIKNENYFGLESQFPFNVTHSVFTKTAKFQPNEIPLLLDVDGYNTFTRGVLSDCFEVKNIPLKTFYGDKRHQSSTHTKDIYVSTNSLCDFMHAQPSNYSFRIFLFVQNPIVSYVMKNDFRGKFSTDLISEKSNLLTRSIICKPKDVKLTKEDVRIAKKFVKGACDVTLVNYNYESIKTLFKRYNWKESPNKCRQSYFNRFRELNRHVDSRDLQRIVESNSEDLSIYLDFVM